MPSYVIDTDIVSEILFGEAQVVTFFKWLESNDKARIFISEITRLELLSMSKLTEELAESIEKFTQCCDDVISVDEVIARKAGELRRITGGIRQACDTCGKKSGGKLKTPDSIIAATAITEEATLITRNVKDYEHICNHVELTIINPFEFEIQREQPWSSSQNND